MLEWWERVDRERELEVVRKLVPDGGCVVLIGDERSGRHQVAKLAEDFLRDFGHDCHRIAQASYPMDLRRTLLRVWEKLSPAPAPTVIPPWVARAGFISTSEVITEVVKLLGRRANRPALVLEDIDRDTPLQGYECGMLRDFSHQAKCPTVLTSRTEARSEWTAVSGLEIVNLEGFTREDVWQCIVRSAQLGQRTEPELRAVMETVTLGSPQDRFDPFVVYNRLAAVAI
jgi:hypothetical protein